MKRHPKMEADIIADLGRTPSALEMRIIRDIVKLEVLIKKDEQQYEAMQPLLRTIGSQKQEKVIPNPLADRIAKNIERHARLLNYLNRKEREDPDTNLIDDILNGL